MRIAVNTRLLLPTKLEGIGWFTHETLSRIVKAHPEHQFVFIFDRAFHPKFIYAANVEGTVLYPPTRHPLLYRLWFDWLLPWKLKAVKADAFLSPDGFLSLRSNIPSLAVMHDLNFEHYPEDLPKAYSTYYRSYFPRFARHATRLATVSDFSRRDIAERYNVPNDRIDLVYNGVGHAYRPLSEDERKTARTTYAEGHDYFICVGSLHPRKNIARLLIAFDKLLSDHPSELRLVIVGERFWWDERMAAAWEQVVHKERILFTGRLEQDRLAHALGGAMALAFVSYFEGFGIPLVEAMQCGVPVVAASTTALPEVAGDAAQYCDPFSVDEIQRALHEVWRDPELRHELSRKGMRRAKRFTWDKAAEDLWNSFTRMCSDAGIANHQK